MSKFLVPITFVPGTKAKAQDVNENFSAVQNELNIKAEKTGDENQQFIVAPATENNHAVTKEQLQTAVEERFEEVSSNFLTPYSIESGYIDDNGNPAVMTPDGAILSFNVDNGVLYQPLIVTPANNQPSFTITELDSVDVSSYTDGVYNVFVKSDGTAYLLNNEIFTQKSKPTEPILNCIFENISVRPLSVEKYNGTEWELFNDVHIGSITVESGTISKIVNHNFANTWAIKAGTLIPSANSNRPAVIIENYQNGYSWYRVYSDGWCEQGGLSSAVTISANGGNTKTMTLLKPYKHEPHVMVSGRSNQGGRCAANVGNSITTTDFIYQIRSFNTSSTLSCSCLWMTRGYLPEGDY